MIDKNCISTISHIRFNPTEPKPENIEITDIAHSLSMLTRANGHFKKFFSVARHSINCANEAKMRGYSEKLQLLCLLHDSAEAYIGDMTRPLKLKIPEFSQIEKKYQTVIFSKYIPEGLTEAEISLAKRIDDDMLYHEFYTYNGEKLLDNAGEISIDLDKSIKSIEETEKEFLNLFYELIK